MKKYRLLIEVDANEEKCEDASEVKAEVIEALNQSDALGDIFVIETTEVEDEG